MEDEDLVEFTLILISIFLIFLGIFLIAKSYTEIKILS
jgi:hypothetical protein